VAWNPLDATYAPVIGADGKPHAHIVKNNLEFKNATRVLVEGNRLTHNWGGFTQKGHMVLLTAKNQGAANGTNVCPLCAVTHVTLRFNHLSYGAAPFQIACLPSDNGGWPAACGNYSIHDNVADYQQYATCYHCISFGTQISGGSADVPLSQVNIRNNEITNEHTGVWLTASTANAALLLGAPPEGVKGMHFDNNVIEVGNNGIYSTGGGTANCFSVGSVIKTLIARCWPDGSMIGNQFTNTTPVTKVRLPWPDGNGINPEAGVNHELLDAAQARRSH
jgi:hypothetical protein